MDKQINTTSTKKLTLKQRKWIKLYIETGSATEAARQVYDCTDESARVIGSENLAKLNYQELLEEAGISDSNLLTTLREGLLANKQLASRVIVKAPGKEADSQTDDFIEVEDYPTRHKYLETALKLKKRLGTETPGGINANINIAVAWADNSKP